MVSLGKNYYPTQYEIIPTAVDATTLKSNAVFDAPAPQAVIKDEELFELMSWTLEDYELAMANDEFFEHVKTKFTDTKEPLLWEERKQLLEDKFFVVGGNARYMFECSVEEAVVELNKAIEATDNIEEYVKGTRGIFSSGAVNRLFSWYRGEGNAESSLLSKHVARKLAQMLGPSFVQKISASLSMNPSLDGHLLELWFFAKLTHGGVECYNIDQDGATFLQEKWESEKVPYFDPNGRIPLNQAKQWLAPQKWNQGGYDAVFVELLDDDERHLVGTQAMRVRIRFVQVTRADKHSFKDQFFAMLLRKLTNSLRGYRFEAVGVYFAVPIRKLATFKPKVDVLQVQKDVLVPAGLEVETTSVAVEVVGLHYKEFRASDDPKRLEIKRFKSE
ncbi:hypothetical protein PHYPSEUDO_013189 [Phytophthora pseudosyringae]|uniref:Uncharacterized protein n=1 Tax=Phytophthora pseudosyringae TaxID=221518 RepID=A0A8T1W7B5_9STRA|nr:hypothetical protein PHYPSEUDO_013189 [Phytophthora pseudosyringae]